MAEYARAIVEGLRSNVGPVNVSETDVARVAGILESVEAGILELPPPPGNLQKWAKKVGEEIETLGEPVSDIVGACTLVALYGLTVNPHFFSELVRNTGVAVAEVLRAGGKDLVKLIQTLLG